MTQNKQESLLNNLNSSINAKNEKDIIKNAKILCNEADNINIKEINSFNKLLKLNNEHIQTVGAELIAELCKNEKNRQIFTNEAIINKLMEFLNSGSTELKFTTIRALGNICYENEEACNLIDKVGIESILRVLRDDTSEGLTTKVSGLLVNLLSMHDGLPKTALKGGILNLIEVLLEKYSKANLEDNKIILTFLLSIANALTDYLDDKEYVFNENMAKTIICIFKKSEIPEISVLCLEIFHSLSEKDEFKCMLAKEGVSELLFYLIEKYKDKINDEESRQILKVACDLIVIILTGDASMDLLYNNGKGKTYQNMLIWLDSNDSDLLSTGILAIGNFARKDTHCSQMVKNGIAKKLIDLLKNYNQSLDLNDCKVQHALLSTLKNLVIPKENKEQALKDGIIEVMYPMLNQDRYMVVFKLLGTFRMVIDGQKEAALNLLSRKDFIERLVYWCYNSDHLGVRGEVPRIFSWLIKNSKSSEPFPMFVSVKDSIKCIVEMILSNHALMQNESFIALNILAVGLSSQHLNVFYACLRDAVLGKNLNFVLNKYGEKWDKATFENCLSLLENLTKSNEIVKELKDNEINECLVKLKSKNLNMDRLGKILEVLAN